MHCRRRFPGGSGSRKGSAADSGEFDRPLVAAERRVRQPAPVNPRKQMPADTCDQIQQDNLVSVADRPLGLCKTLSAFIH